MLNNVELKFITPANLQELEPFWEDIHFLHSFTDSKLSKPDIHAVISSCVPNITFVTTNGVMFGFFILDVYTNSVELHGVVRKDSHRVVPNHKRVKLFIFQVILDTIFKEMGKEKLVIKGRPDNVGVRGFALMYGFKRLPYLDKGEHVWVLHKEKYFKGLNLGKEKES